MKKIGIILFVLCFACKAQEIPNQFSLSALQDKFVTLNNETVTLETILSKYKGKTIVIDVWASWCKDCIEGFPVLKDLQSQNSEVIYVFLSLDKTIPQWRKAIKKYNLEGEHFYMQSGWDGPLGNFLDLDWIPRYLIVDKDQNIKLYKAVKANDKNLKEALK